jgi:hypothetical protein
MHCKCSLCRWLVFGVQETVLSFTKCWNETSVRNVTTRHSSKNVSRRYTGPQTLPSKSQGVEQSDVWTMTENEVIRLWKPWEWLCGRMGHRNRHLCLSRGSMDFLVCCGTWQASCVHMCVLSSWRSMTVTLFPHVEVSLAKILCEWPELSPFRNKSESGRFLSIYLPGMIDCSTILSHIRLSWPYIRHAGHTNNCWVSTIFFKKWDRYKVSLILSVELHCPYCHGHSHRVS